MVAACSDNHWATLLRAAKISSNRQVSLLNDVASVEKPAAEPDTAPARTILEIDNLQTHFFTPTGVVRAVDGVSYSGRSGETLRVSAQSPSSKTAPALSPPPPLPPP